MNSLVVAIQDRTVFIVLVRLFYRPEKVDELRADLDSLKIRLVFVDVDDLLDNIANVEFAFFLFEFRRVYLGKVNHVQYRVRDDMALGSLLDATLLQIFDKLLDLVL